MPELHCNTFFIRFESRPSYRWQPLILSVISYWTSPFQAKLTSASVPMMLLHEWSMLAVVKGTDAFITHPEFKYIV